LAIHSVLMDYCEANARLNNRDISIPTLGAAAFILTTQGADQIYIPVQGMFTEMVRDATSKLAPSLKRRIKPIDTNGKVSRRVHEFVRPIRSSASEDSQERSFCAMTENMLYHMALASKYRATSIDGDLSHVQEIISAIKLEKFKGEAKHRLAQVVHLVAGYEPFYIDKLGIIQHISEPGVGTEIQHILDTAEFADVVGAQGKLGYLRNPRIGLRRVSSTIHTLVKRREFRSLVAATRSISSLAKIALPVDIVDELIAESDDNFSPVFGTLSPFYQTIYETSLFEYDPKCRTLPGKILDIQPFKLGVCGHMWRDSGESAEQSIEKELQYAKRVAERVRSPRLFKSLSR